MRQKLYEVQYTLAKIGATILDLEQQIASLSIKPFNVANYSSTGTDDVNPSWTMLMARNKNELFPAGKLEAIKAMVLKHKDEFSNVHDTLI